MQEPGGDGDAATDTLIECAESLLTAVRVGDSPDAHLDRLADCDDEALGRIRRDRDAALAFWSNLYNAGTQLLLDRRPDLYESPLRMVRFFRANAVYVAGVDLSLDDIEHGILRSSRSKYGLGYLPRLASGSFVRRHRLETVDPRIHFALNCGAASCPAIRAYEAGRIDEQLDLATETYLDSTVEYDSGDGVVSVPRLFLWYHGDFGGKPGTVSLLKEYGVLPSDASPSVTYRSWNWSLAPRKFADA